MTERKPKQVVLCVDDNLEVLQALRRQLRGGLDGVARVEVASSAEKALDRMEVLAEAGRNGVVIVSDWLMPGLRGDEFVAQIKQRFGEIPVVVLSGHITLEATDILNNLPQVLKILPKPWAGDELLSLVRTGLQQTETQRTE